MKFRNLYSPHPRVPPSCRFCPVSHRQTPRVGLAAAVETLNQSVQGG